MFKKTMEYTDYNGKTVTEDFYFSLSKAELIEMEMSAGEDGYSALLQKIITEENRSEMLKIFRQIILLSVGRRSEDGRRFIKNDDIREEFEQTPAFSDLLVEFYTKPDAVVEFISGVMPAGMEAEVKKAIEDGRTELGETQVPVAQISDAPAERTWKDYTRNQLVEMPKEEFESLVTMKMMDMPRELLAVAMQRKAAEEAAK